MPFVPKRWKYRKQQKGKRCNKILGTIVTLKNRLYSGNIGLRALEAGTLTSKQLLTIKQTLNKAIKRRGKVYIRVFPQKPITEKPAEVRMGKGKGNVEYWNARFKQGTLLVEIESPNLKVSLLALKLLQFKLSLKTKIIFSF